MKKFFGFFIVIICFSINANTSFSTLPACKKSDCKDKAVIDEIIKFTYNPNQPNTYSYTYYIEYDDGDYFYEKVEVNFNSDQNYQRFKEPPSTPNTITPPSTPNTITPPSTPNTITPPSTPNISFPQTEFNYNYYYHDIRIPIPYRSESQQTNYHSIYGYDIKGTPPGVLSNSINSLINGGINTPVKVYPNSANLESGIDY